MFNPFTPGSIAWRRWFFGAAAILILLYKGGVIDTPDVPDVPPPAEPCPNGDC